MQKMFGLKKGMKLCIQKDSLFISVGEFYMGVSRAKALAGFQRPSIRKGAASVVSRLLLQLKIAYFFFFFLFDFLTSTSSTAA